MKKLLVFDRKRNNRQQIVEMLQIHKPVVGIEEAGSISEVLKKLTFGKKTPLERNHENLLIVGLSVPDPEILYFVVYLGKNKPDLKVLLYTPDNYGGLKKVNLISFGNLTPSFCMVTANLNESIVGVFDKQQISQEAAMQS